MSNEFKIEYLKKLFKYNRIVYGALIAVALLSRGAGLTKSNFLLFYYSLTGLFFFAFDEIFISKRITGIEEGALKFPAILFKIRTYLFVIILSVGSIFSVLPHILFISVYFMCLYIIVQEILLCDIFNSYSNTVRVITVMGIASLILFFIHLRSEVEGVWFVMYVASILIVLIVTYVIYDMYSSTIKKMDDKYTKLYFQNTDLIAENDKLIEFREKVEKVNSEINYQKINLTKANDDLEKSNEESRSLIEVMKYFSASFDVEKNVHVMIDNIMKVKKAGAVGFYIDKGIYMNDSPYLDVISANDVSTTLLKQDLYDIYNAIKRRDSLEPLVLCDNYDFKYPYLTGGNICNAVAFPAYENENIYGVMVVTSSKYEFFLNGYSFYESSVMDFTSALISDRLYLKTEDMAKKDGLTKIFNRIYFNQFFPELKSEVTGERVSLTVAMMDIDHFKNVNDTYGHLAGDEVIKMVASIDDKYAKLYNGTAVRFGGEEFLLILKDMDIARANDILERMHEEIVQNTVEFEDLKIKVNVSMGLASYPETCESVDDVVDRADQALYYSKEHGRGRITIDGREGE
ncbi:diguanylate cyclase with GAF sensor [Lachnospiraceae bacterium]|nr:diguanylate cyclase with GAF sensor [Lachnospiraceae bacterium]